MSGFIPRSREKRSAWGEGHSRQLTGRSGFSLRLDQAEMRVGPLQETAFEMPFDLLAVDRTREHKPIRIVLAVGQDDGLRPVRAAQFEATVFRRRVRTP